MTWLSQTWASPTPNMGGLGGSKKRSKKSGSRRIMQGVQCSAHLLCIWATSLLKSGIFMDFLRALEAFFRHNCDNAMPIESNWHILPRIALSKSHQISSATCKAVWFSNLKLKATTCASESLPKCNSSQDVTRCHKMSQDVTRCRKMSIQEPPQTQGAPGCCYKQSLTSSSS